MSADEYGRMMTICVWYSTVVCMYDCYSVANVLFVVSRGSYRTIQHLSQRGENIATKQNSVLVPYPSEKYSSLSPPEILVIIEDSVIIEDRSTL